MPVAFRPANPWIYGNRIHPTAYETSGLVISGLVCEDPQSRLDAVYNPDQHLSPEDMQTSSMQYLGIGCCWRETGISDPTCSVVWSGKWAPPEHVEATPLINVVPGTLEHGFGAWPSYLPVGETNVPAVFVGTIGNPPEYFDIVDLGAFTPPAQSVATTVELRSDGTGATAWVAGTQIVMGTAGLGPVPIPAALLGSTLHGLAYDCHVYEPPEDIPTALVCRNWSCT